MFFTVCTPIFRRSALACVSNTHITTRIPLRYITTLIDMDKVIQPISDKLDVSPSSHPEGEHPAPKLQVSSHNQYSTPDALSPTNVRSSPLDQFQIWFAEAVSGGKVNEPEAMTVSTATKAGIPSSRMVLFKQLDSRGFVFYTNYTSRKSREILENPHASLVFYWREVSRSVRVLGKVEKLDEEDSKKYFDTRPLGSRLGAWASPQSTAVGEGEMAERLEKVKNKFGVTDETRDADIPLPEFWGGWRVVPLYVSHFHLCCKHIS